MSPDDAPQAARPPAGDFLSWLIVCAAGCALIVYLAFWSSGAVPGPAPASGGKRPPHLTAFVPPRAVGVATGLMDHHGYSVLANCGSCHATRPADMRRQDAADLNQFHQGLAMKHGELACVACHNPGDSYQSLRLADGRTVPFGESITLCAQCHGTQHRDYKHGAHGGMAGYWDTTRGPRQRNTCIACHDPHAPAYPKVRPAPGPNDRFLTPLAEVRHD